MYEIIGEFQGHEEELDTARDEEDAKRKVAALKLAYGNQWSIWYQESGDG